MAKGNAKTLTAALIERITPPRKGRVEVFDKSCGGLAIRVGHGGTKSFVHFYRHNGQQRRSTLGTYPEMSVGQARAALHAQREMLARGEDPAGASTEASTDSDGAQTFVATVQLWLKRDQSDKSRRDVAGMMRRETSAWNGRPIGAITKRECRDLIEAIADRGVMTTARRVHTHLHRLFAWCLETDREGVTVNPVADLAKPGQAIERERVLEPDELRLIWKACDDLGDDHSAGKNPAGAPRGYPFAQAIKLLALTACRRDEIGSLSFSEVDLKNKTITLKGKRTKNGETRIVPLSKAALAILESLPHLTGKGKSEFVFTVTGNSPISGWSRAKEQIDAGAAARNVDKKALPHWTWHDLRRTAATNMEALGVRLQVVEHILGHTAGSKAGIARIYQRHDYKDEKRAALDAWADKLATMTGDNIVPLPNRRRRVG